MVATADIGRVAAGLLQENMERSPRGGTRRTATRDAERDRQPLSRSSLVVRCAWKSCRANPGRVSSSRRARRTRLPRMQMLDGFQRRLDRVRKRGSRLAEGKRCLGDRFKGPGQTRGQVSLNLTDFDHSLLEFFRESPTPNHALQRTRPARSGCNPRVPWAGSLSFCR